MKNTHTEGEWTLGLYPNKNYPHRVVMTTNGVAISEVIEKPDLKEMEANAKLIAAAPDLLDSVMKLMDELNDVTVEFPEHTYDILNKIEAAIKKAIGE